jgi:imidazoleglycerol-phosphate dehydratase
MRTAKIHRKTAETDIKIDLNIDGSGNYCVNTGIPFLDHMLSAMTKHGVFDLEISVKGDLEIDIHHSNEDVGIALGNAFAQALGDKKGIVRYATSIVPLDEALVRTALDVSGRPYMHVEPETIEYPEKDVYTWGYFKQFLRAFMNGAGLNIHVDVIRGEDPHHILECAFKSLGIALDRATCIDPRKTGIPSTKGVL